MKWQTPSTRAGACVGGVARPQHAQHGLAGCMSCAGCCQAARCCTCASASAWNDQIIGWDLDGELGGAKMCIFASQCGAILKCLQKLWATLHTVCAGLQRGVATWHHLPRGTQAHPPCRPQGAGVKKPWEATLAWCAMWVQGWGWCSRVGQPPKWHVPRPWLGCMVLHSPPRGPPSPGWQPPRAHQVQACGQDSLQARPACPGWHVGPRGVPGV